MWTARFVPAAVTFPVTALGDTSRLAVELESLADWNQRIGFSIPGEEYSIEARWSPSEVVLPARGRLGMQVRFHPVEVGARGLEVRVTGAESAPLIGEGEGKEDPCRVEPARLAFGRLDPGETKTLGFRVVCDGPDSVAGSVESPCLDFAVTEGGGAFRLAPGEWREVRVTYRPLALGEDACFITLGAEWCEAVVCTGRASRTWRVLADGSGDAPTVQAGIDSASHGDVVLVGPGRYYETINLRGKGIHLLGERGPAATILDGSRGDDSVVACESGETNATVIEGFTITGGRGRIRAINGRMGAGILCLDATPVIQGNVIERNRAITPLDGNQSRGGGVFYGRGEGSPPLTELLVLRGNLIIDNYAAYLGGGMVLAGPATVEGNIVSQNEAGRDGGGAYIGGNDLKFFRNRIAENIAGDHGGGIYITNSGIGAVAPERIEVAFNVIRGNSAFGLDNALDCSGGAIWVSGGAWIHHNTILFNDSESRQPPAAGGICLFATFEGTLVESNLMYGNTQSGVVAYWWASGTEFAARARRNLVFANGAEEFHNNQPSEFDLRLEENVYADPLLCLDGSESDGSVAENSPALRQPWGVIGAVAEPGCGPHWDGPPDSTTAVERFSWGAIQARYGP